MRRLILALALALLLGLAGCGEKLAFHATDITGAPIGGDFKLTGHDGRPRSLADFRGKVVVLFFGYTHCPDVCPTTMSELARVMKELGPRAEKVQVLFVTVDPERDTAEVLAQYVPAFNPGFLGLVGDPAALEAAAKAFKIYYHKSPGKTPESYSMDHTAGMYVYDPEGRIRLFVNQGIKPADLARDIGQLLDGK